MKHILDNIDYYPFFCNLQITQKCNLNCLHCGFSSGDTDKEELSLKELYKLIDDLSHLKCERIQLTGGEPLLRDDWRAIVDRITRRGIEATLISNGSLISSTIANSIKESKISTVGISIDGTKDSHNKIRNNSSSYKKAILALDNLRRCNVPTGVITTVTKWNINVLEELRQVLIQHGAVSWRLQIPSLMGRMTLQDHIIPTGEDIRKIHSFIAESRRDNLITVIAGDSIGYFGRDEKTIRDIGGDLPYFTGCYAGCLSVAIESNGNVKGCLALPPELSEGNIRNTSLREIWCGENAFSYNRKFDISMLKGFCKKCEFGEICRAGCKSIAYGATNCLHDNPLCDYRINLIGDKSWWQANKGKGYAIADTFKKLKELLKRVAGNKAGDQRQIISDFINNHKFNNTDFAQTFTGEHEWEEQLQYGIVEPIYNVYRITLKDALSGIIRDEFENSGLLQDTDISPLIAIYSQFAQRRISIYPYDDFIESLIKSIKTGDKANFKNTLDEGVTKLNILNKLDDYFLDSRMSITSYAINHIEEHNNKFPFRFDRPNIVKNITDEKREEIFESLGKFRKEIIDLTDSQQNEQFLSKLAINKNKPEWQYLNKLLDDYFKRPKLEFNVIECIDFARASLLTNHPHIYIFDLSFSRELFAHRSIVLLIKNEAERFIDDIKTKEKWERLVYSIDHILSYVLAFEANLKTYDMFLRSSDFIIKKSESNWHRINSQIKFISTVNNEINLNNPPFSLILHRYAEVTNHVEERRQVLSSLSSLLPEIQEYISVSEHAAYRMPKYFSKSFRTLLLKEGVFEPKTAHDIYKNMLREVKLCFYDFVVEPSITPDDYVMERCIGKYEERIIESARIAEYLLKQHQVSEEVRFATNPKKAYEGQWAIEILNKIFSNSYHEINLQYNIAINEKLQDYYKKQYSIDLKETVNIIQNERTCVIRFKGFSEFKKFLENNKDLFTPPPDDIRLIHGDLHFDNILIDALDLNNPVDKLIDPGDFFIKGGDIAYDLGKLMHSFDGLYDFIHEGLYDLRCQESVTNNERVLNCFLTIIADEFIFKKPIGTGGSGATVDNFSPLYGGEIVNYLYIRRHNDSIIKEVFPELRNDSERLNHLIRRAKFNEAMHFCTMVPFHIEKDPNKALAIFITGLVLMKLWKNRYVQKKP